MQSGVQDIKDISKYNYSGFMDEDEKGDNFFKEDKKVPKFFEEHALGLENNNKEEILADIPGNESDLDEVKGLKTMIDYLKKDNKEKDKKFESLVEQIKELFKGMKCDSKNKLQISQIFQIIGYPPEVINMVTNSKKGNIMDLIEKNNK